MTVKQSELNSAPRTAPLQSAATLGMLSAAGVGGGWMVEGGVVVWCEGRRRAGK